MKKTVAAILIISLLLSLCSCTTTGANTELTVGVEKGADLLDPIAISNNCEKMIADNCFEGLMYFDENGKPELSGATGYSLSGDMLIYTFSLNPSAKWYVSDEVRSTLASTGIKNFDTAITADDFIYGIDRLMQKGCKELDGIFKITAEDEYTLKIILKSPDVDFIYKLASLPIYPCSEKFVTALGGIYATTSATIITNGPYCIENIKSDGSVTLAKSPDYNGKLRVLNKKIKLTAADKFEDIYNCFENGEYNIYTASTFNRPDAQYKSSSSEVTQIWGICFNYGKKTVKNDNLRKAVLTSMDTTTIKTPSFASGKGARTIPETYFIGNELYGAFKKEDIPVEYSPDYAESFLTKALSELGCDFVTLELFVPEQLKASFLRITEQWQTLFGEKLVIDLRTFAAEDYDEVAEKNEYDIAVLPLTPEKNTALGVLETLGGSPCYFTDKKFENYKNDISNDPEKTSTSFKYAENYLSINCIFVPLFYSGIDLYESDGISGIYFADRGEKIYFHKGVRED